MTKTKPDQTEPTGALGLIHRRRAKKVSTKSAESGEELTRRASNAHRRARYQAKKSGEKQPNPTAFVGEKPAEGWRDLSDTTVQDVLITCLENDLWRENACKCAKVSNRTVESWCSKGRLRAREIEDWTEQSIVMRDAGEGEPAIMRELGPRPGYNRYAEFNDRVEQAEAQSEEALIGPIHNKARKGDVRSCEWLLERKHPKRYGKATVTGQYLQDQTGQGSEADPMAELTGILAGISSRLIADHEDDQEKD